MSQGFAVKHNGNILIRTVSDTERGVKTNGLLVLFRLMVTRAWTDELIDRYWKIMIRKKNIEIVPIRVTEEVSDQAAYYAMAAGLDHVLVVDRKTIHPSYSPANWTFDTWDADNPRWASMFTPDELDDLVEQKKVIVVKSSFQGQMLVLKLVDGKISPGVRAFLSSDGVVPI